MRPLTASLSNPSTVHEEKESFICHSCEASFDLKTDLSVHVASVHEEKKPFICFFCDAGFTLKTDLKDHIDCVHKGKPLKCKNCEAHFKSEIDLNHHFMTVHKGNNQNFSEEFSFCFVTAGSIKRIIKGLKNTKAMGVDQVPTTILKKGVAVLSGPIARVCNLSLSSGIFPDIFKQAIVHPVFKGDGKDPHNLGSYCPISILPSLSKILEIAVGDALLDWLKYKNAISDSQFSFMPGRSVSMALTCAQAD